MWRMGNIVAESSGSGRAGGEERPVLMGAMSRVTRVGLALALAASVRAGVGAATKDQIEAISSALRARDFDTAVELTRSALTASPNDAQLWTLQGIAFSRKGDSGHALAAFEHALKISPEYVAALEGAAQLHYQAGSRAAVPLLHRLLQLRPDDPTSHAMLAVLEYRDGNCQSAVAHFEHAGELLNSELDG